MVALPSFVQTRAVFLCLLALYSGLRAESLPRSFDHYQQRIWNEENGLPQNTVSAITRTHDGYLWMGTIEGLVRFDGVRFTVFDRANTPGLRDNAVSALLEDHSRTLWIGTDGGGLTSLKNGHFTAYGAAEGLADLRITCLFEDRAGVLWVGTQGGGLHVLRDGHFEVLRPSGVFAFPRISVLAQDPAGSLWAGTDTGLMKYADGVWTTFPAHENATATSIRALYVAPNGGLWIGTDGSGVQRLIDGKFSVDGIDPQLRNGRVWAICADAEGALWFGCFGAGLHRLTSDGEVTSFGAANGLSNDLVKSIYRDPEGSIWVGTDAGGLSQFFKGRFTAYTNEDGLANDDSKALLEDSTGAIWAGSTRGVSRSHDGGFQRADTDSDLADSRVTSIAQDRAGKLWFASTSPAGEGRIYRLQDGQFQRQPTSEHLNGSRPNVLMADRENGLWIGTSVGGVHYRRSDGEIVTYRKESGSMDDFVTTFYQDRAGSIWIGTAGRGMSRLQAGNFTFWTTKNGLTSNHVLCFHEDAEGVLWIGTHGGGLQRFKDGKFSAITRHDGLYDDLAFVILEDDSGNFWMSGNKGVYRASRRELNDFADGKISAVTSFSYGTDDGMLSRECSGAMPAGIKTRDGRLWFPTIKGVVSVDPATTSRQPPQMAIERVRIDGNEARPNESLRFRPPNESIEVDYMALSWARPKQIRFRYRVAGLDRQWTEAGTRRTAYFSHLPPGNFRFEVIADNGEGAWASQPASFAFEILPPFWRTWWFQSSVALLVLAAIAGGFRGRVLRLQRRVAAQEEFSRRLMDAHESERRRIAAELHDGLGQTLAMIKNRAIANDDAKITEQSAEAIAEMREIAHNLRPYLLDRLGLTRALRSLFDKIGETASIHLEAKVEDIDGRFAPQDEISLYRVVQENLNNILKHSDASDAEISIRATPDFVRITMHDNGRGFDPDRVSLGQTSTGGFGLVGIAERVRLLGGTHAIVSAPGQGTTVTIELPSVKYQRNGETPPHPAG